MMKRSIHCQRSISRQRGTKKKNSQLLPSCLSSNDPLAKTKWKAAHSGACEMEPAEVSPQKHETIQIGWARKLSAKGLQLTQLQIPQFVDVSHVMGPKMLGLSLGHISYWQPLITFSFNASGFPLRLNCGHLFLKCWNSQTLLWRGSASEWSARFSTLTPHSHNIGETADFTVNFHYKMPSHVPFLFLLC